MIQNLVFDMGNVLVGYKADPVSRHFMTDETEIHTVTSAVFDSQEWALLDLGVIPEDEALEQIKKRLPTDRLKEMADLVFWHWHEYNMWQLPGAEALIRAYKAKGFGIYLCSNASVRLLQCYKTILPAVDCFDGILFSGPEVLMKPQKEIYERLFAKFGLKPEECFFVDDLKRNVEGARRCGMDGYVYDGNLELLKARLEQLNTGLA